jgi:hypothetical protein
MTTMRSPAARFSRAVSEVQWLLRRVGLDSPEVRQFPRDVEILLKLAFCVKVVRMPKLTRANALAWTRRNERDILLPESVEGDLKRPLHGFLVATRRTSIIFVCANYPMDSQRFAIAHEGGHLVRDYHLKGGFRVGEVGLADRLAYVHELDDEAFLAAWEAPWLNEESPRSTRPIAEHYTDLFAIELLAPMRVVYDLHDAGYCGRRLAGEIRQMFRVSQAAADRRTRELLGNEWNDCSCARVGRVA